MEKLFKRYLDDIKAIKNENIDLNNLDFHCKFELIIKAPESWNLFWELCNAILEGNPEFYRESMCVFYSDTDCYRKAVKSLDFEEEDKDIKLLSYYELHSAIATSSHDVRPQKRIQGFLSSSNVVIVLSASQCPDIVLNAIRRFTSGALILLD